MDGGEEEEEIHDNLPPYPVQGPSGCSDGGESSLNAHLACELLQDMYDKLRETHSGPIVRGYLAHSTNVQLCLTALGMSGQDIPLGSDNYED